MQKAKLCTFYSTLDLWTLAKEFHDNNFGIELLSESLPKVKNCGSSIRTSGAAPSEALNDHDTVASAPSLDTSQGKAAVRPGRRERLLGGAASRGGGSTGITVT